MYHDLRNVTPEFFDGKMETFLTCLALSRKFNLSLGGISITEVALEWIFHTIVNLSKSEEFQLLLSELPNILSLDYSAAKKIHKICIQRLVQVKDSVRLGITDASKLQYWRDFAEFDYTLRLLKTFENYTHK